MSQIAAAPSSSCCPTVWTPAAAPAACTSASLRPTSHQTPLQPGKSLLLLLTWCGFYTVHVPGICEPGWAWAELELFPSTVHTPLLRHSPTRGDICQDPYRPGAIVVVLFCLRPINYPSPPPRNRPILSRRLCHIHRHTHTRPPSPGGIHPSVSKYQPRPVFVIVYKPWLDHSCLVSPATYCTSFPTAPCVRTTSCQQLPRAKDRSLLLALFLSLSFSLYLSICLSYTHRLGFSSSSQPAYLYGQPLISPQQQLSCNNHELTHNHAHPHTHTHTHLSTHSPQDV